MSSVAEVFVQAIVIILQSILNVVVEIICRFRFGSLKDVVPSIKEPLLLEPAVDLARKIRNKELTSEEVVRAYIERIRKVNPIINAVTDERFEDALKEAKRMDEFVRNGSKTSDQIAEEQPFLGVPFTTKNIIGIQGLSQDAGVVGKKDDIADEDCEVVALLRKAGGIPVVATNVPQLSMSWDTSNQIHGRTKNPYDLGRSPGGSSGGEAALIAAAGSVIGIGNDIGGSIRIPCSFCGIFGHKSTSGLVSNKQQFPSCEGSILNSYRSTGPMCRYACDLLPLLKVLAGENASKLKTDKKINISDLTVYYTNNYIQHPQVFSVDQEIQDGVKKAVAYLKTKFNIKTEAVSIPELDESVEIILQCLFEPRADEWMTLMTAGKGDFNIIPEFIKWFFGRSDHTMFCLLLALHIRLKNLKDPERIDHGISVLARLRARFNKLLDHKSVFIYPTSPGLAPFPYHVVSSPKNVTYTAAFNLLGFPSTQCPLGLSECGLPLGVQVIGQPYTDATTIAVAEELEKAFGGWISP